MMPSDRPRCIIRDTYPGHPTSQNAVFRNRLTNRLGALGRLLWVARKTPKRHFRPPRDRSHNTQTGPFWDYQTVSPRTPVKGVRRKAGPDRTPALPLRAPLKRHLPYYGAGHVSGAGGVSMGRRGSCASAVSLSPACSLAAHSPAGMNSWMNAKAGEAIMTISTDAVTSAASVLLSLLKTKPPSSSVFLVRSSSLVLA